MKTITYLTAAWCAPCKQYGPLVESLAEGHGLAVRKLDIDTDEGAAVASRHGVLSVPTLVSEQGAVAHGRLQKSQLDIFLKDVADGNA